jgi:hypothetical protein
LAQWQAQFAFWSIPTIKRTICSLEETGLLLTFSPRDFRKIKHYAINYDLLNDDYLQNTNAFVKAHETRSKNCVRTPEYQSSRPLDQNDPIDGIKMILSNGSNCTSRSGQNDPIDGIKLIPSHYRENTTEITTENTPPLTPPYFSTRQAEEEEEKELKNSNFNFESSNSPSRQPQNLPLTHAVHQTKEEALTNQEHTLFREMIEIWNQSVQSKLNSGQEVRLTDKRKALLRQCMNEVFCDIADSIKMDAWRNYCTLIGKSKFLSGKNTHGFKVTLDWACVPNNACKVLEGAIYDKPEPVKTALNNLSSEEFAEEVARSAPSSKYLSQWVKMSVVIAQFIGQQKYRHWFSRVSLNSITDTTATFLVEGSLTKDIIIRQYSSELRCAVQKLYPSVHQLEFKVVSNLGDNE